MIFYIFAAERYSHFSGVLKVRHRNRSCLRRSAENQYPLYHQHFVMTLSRAALPTRRESVGDISRIVSNPIPFQSQVRITRRALLLEVKIERQLHSQICFAGQPRAGTGTIPSTPIMASPPMQVYGESVEKAVGQWPTRITAVC